MMSSSVTIMGNCVLLLLSVYYAFIHKTMFAISPDSVDLNYERSRKKVFLCGKRNRVFFVVVFCFQVLRKHQLAMPTCSKLRHKLYLQNTKTYK